MGLAQIDHQNERAARDLNEHLDGLLDPRYDPPRVGVVFQDLPHADPDVQLLAHRKPQPFPQQVRSQHPLQNHPHLDYDEELARGAHVVDLCRNPLHAKIVRHVLLEALLESLLVRSDVRRVVDARDFPQPLPQYPKHPGSRVG